MQKLFENWQKFIKEDKSRGPYLYSGTEKTNVPKEIKDAIKKYRELPEEKRKETPLLYWLLGDDGTPPYKMTKLEAAYTDKSPYKQNCGNCARAYQNVTTGVHICDWMRGEIKLAGWCNVWHEPWNKKEYTEYQEKNNEVPK